MGRIIAILYKEFLQMKRDRLTIGLIFMLPMVQLLLFGFAIQTEVKHVPTVIFDQSLSQESREMLDAFRASGYFDIVEVAGSYGEVTHLIDSGQVKAGIIFPPDFARNLTREIRHRYRCWWMPLITWFPLRPLPLPTPLAC
ncbi:hypothetical protein N752_01655 [Desulforamulus aquiferis]|nr:hypothetical protein N752_01655 [Desulforamulus aquiferis]